MQKEKDLYQNESNTQAKEIVVEQPKRYITDESGFVVEYGRWLQDKKDNL